MKDIVYIQKWLNGRWQKAAEVAAQEPEKGLLSPSSLNYENAYIISHMGNESVAGVSCLFPANFKIHNLETWPPFLLDIMPSGAGRTHWLSRLGMADGISADWALLKAGAGHPPGNLRVEGGGQILQVEHSGFDLEDIIERQENFIEYAASHGAHVAGCSDVQGVAPKFLLTKDDYGKWHAEGALPDEKVAESWIVKFPRGRKEADQIVLKNEAPYMAVARALGIDANKDVYWDNDCLFIKRFDRLINEDKSLQRLGLESLYSLTGTAQFGVSLNHEVFCEALKEYTTDPDAALIEYLKRDILNVILGNKDNHGRNSAVLKDEAGNVALSPLYDFAPMYLDPEGIARVTRWEKDKESFGQPDWGKVIESLPFVCGLANAKKELALFAKELERLPEIMSEVGLSQKIIDARSMFFVDNLRLLNDYFGKGKTNGSH